MSKEKAEKDTEKRALEGSWEMHKIYIGQFICFLKENEAETYEGGRRRMQWVLPLMEYI